MFKKTFRVLLKTFWVIILLFAPSIIILVTIKLKYSSKQTDIYISLYYILPILLTTIGICVALFVWKNIYTLLALSLGFLITPLSYAFMAWHIGGGAWRDFNRGFGGANFSIMLTAIIYAFPFAAVSFIPIVIRWIKRKNF